MLKIYIPSRGRPDARRTQRSIEGCWPKTHIITVVDKNDAKEYAAAMPDDNILVYPGKRGIGNVRQWILEHHAEAHRDPRLVMLDDDLRFMCRREDDKTKAVKISKEDTRAMFQAIEAQLSLDVHGSVLPRQGANNEPPVNMLLNRRLLRVLAYDARKVLAAGVKFNRLEFMEDFDVTLQLLEVGYANFTLCRWWQDQYVSNAPGGCSMYRTPEGQAKAAYALKALHPNVVSVVTRKTKVSWDGIGERTDVRIQWKKAYRSNL